MAKGIPPFYQKDLRSVGAIGARRSAEIKGLLRRVIRLQTTEIAR